MGSWTLGTRVSYGKYELAWLHSFVASAKMCSSAFSEGHRQAELELFLSRQSCDMVAELRTAALQGQHPPSSARVQMEIQSKPERQLKGTIRSVYCFRNS